MSRKKQLQQAARLFLKSSPLLLFLMVLGSAKSEADDQLNAHFIDSSKEPPVDHGYSSGVQAVEIFYFPLGKTTIPIAVRPRSTLSSTPGGWEVEPLICINECDEKEVTIELLPDLLRAWLSLRIQERLGLPANNPPRVFQSSLLSLRCVIADKNGLIVSFEKERPGDRLTLALTKDASDRLKTGIESNDIKMEFTYEKMSGATSYATAGANRRSRTLLSDEMKDRFEKSVYLGLKGELEAKTQVHDVVVQTINLGGADSAKLLPMLADGIATKVLSSDLRDLSWVQAKLPPSEFQTLTTLLSENREEQALSNTKGTGSSFGKTKAESNTEGVSYPFIYNRDRSSSDTSSSSNENNESKTSSSTLSMYAVNQVRVTSVNVVKLESELASLSSISFSPSLSPVTYKGNPYVLSSREVNLIAQRDLKYQSEIWEIQNEIAQIEAMQVSLRKKIFDWVEADRIGRESKRGILNQLIQKERSAVRGNFFVPHILEWQANCEIQNKRGEVQHIRDWMNWVGEHGSLSRFDHYQQVSGPQYLSCQNALNAYVSDTETNALFENDRLQKMIDQFHSNDDRLRALQTKLINLLQK